MRIYDQKKGGNLLFLENIIVGENAEEIGKKKICTNYFLFWVVLSGEVPFRFCVIGDFLWGFHKTNDILRMVETRMLRQMLGKRRRRIGLRNEHIFELAKVVSNVDKLLENILTWFGCIQ